MPWHLTSVLLTTLGKTPSDPPGMWSWMGVHAGPPAGVYRASLAVFFGTVAGAASDGPLTGDCHHFSPDF